MKRQYKTRLDATRSDLLSEIVSRVIRAVSPEQVIVFGSFARGNNRPESDLDLLIIKESNRPRYERAIPIYHALRDIMMAVDVIVYTPAEVKEWSKVRQAFITTALREGRVLYEKKIGSNPLLDSQSRKRSDRIGADSVRRKSP
ncbi:MAG TPA: nucleotidyltransferase domain-containing protein [bacterium]|jgi:predicted nucleotidyltransferase